MIKVYSTFRLNQAERLVEMLIKNGIDAFVIDFSKRTPGSKIGRTVHEIPTVFIVDNKQHINAMKVVGDFDPQFIRALKESDIGKIPFYKVLIILGVILTLSLFGAVLWTWG